MMTILRLRGWSRLLLWLCLLRIDLCLYIYLVDSIQYCDGLYAQVSLYGLIISDRSYDILHLVDLG